MRTSSDVRRTEPLLLSQGQCNHRVRCIGVEYPVRDNMLSCTRYCQLRVVSCSCSTQVLNAARPISPSSRSSFLDGRRSFTSTTTTPGAPEQRDMTDRVRTATMESIHRGDLPDHRLSVRTSQEDEPLDDHKSPDRSSGSLPAQKLRPKSRDGGTGRTAPGSVPMAAVPGVGLAVPVEAAAPIRSVHLEMHLAGAGSSAVM